MIVLIRKNGTVRLHDIGTHGSKIERRVAEMLAPAYAAVRIVPKKELPKDVPEFAWVWDFENDEIKIKEEFVGINWDGLVECLEALEIENKMAIGANFYLLVQEAKNQNPLELDKLCNGINEPIAKAKVRSLLKAHGLDIPW